MKHIIFIFLLIIGSYSAFSQTNSESTTKKFESKNASIEVYINKKGKILLDGKKVSLEDLDKTLKKMSAQKGIVKYARANILNNKKVLEASRSFTKLITKHQNRLEVYYDKTFSKIILE